ncbi:MAG TPA: hypothetical protein VEO56_16995 [Bacteroidota bacterium]|nr:hypothetical protein [Bacteroidota bacterium]
MSTRTLPMVLLLSILAPGASAQLGGQPGDYSRMGFGARGMGLGNAMTAVVTGDVAGYYNPAVIPLATVRSASASFGILSLDRQLNFLVITLPLPPAAGVSAGIINSGVSNIDGRDADGEQTGPMKTTEDQAFLGFGLRFPTGLSVGINLKLYYYHLYTDMSSTTVGIDLGALYALNRALSVGFSVKDISSKYKWDSSVLYGEQGSAVVDRFPMLYTGGLAYSLPDSLGLISADIEFTNVQSTTLRLGAEIVVIPEIALRAGVDRIDLREKGMGIRPAFGFTAKEPFGSWTPAINYAYVIEPFAPSGMHMISLGIIF